MPAGVKRELQVRSSTLVGTSGPSVTTERGTKDVMPQAQAPDTSDFPPQATSPGFARLKSDATGTKEVGEHLSWKALQQTPENSSGMLAGAGSPRSDDAERGAAGGGEIRQEMGQPKHMPGVVPRNKAPF